MMSMKERSKDMAHRARRALLERIMADDAIVYASHFPALGIGRIVRRNQLYYW